MFLLSLLFFVIGTVEFFIDLWERLVSVRLKIFPTLCFAVLNQYIDLAMWVFIFYFVDEFVYNWHHGIHDYKMLVPLIFYTNGKILGTTLAPFVYARHKKKGDREKAAKLLAKPPHKSHKKRPKRHKKVAEAIQAASAPETLLDSIEMEDLKTEVKERAVEAATQQIKDKIDEAFNSGEESK